MNQILSVEPPNKKRKSNKSSIHSIVLVFAIILIIFGVGLTSTGAYSYYKKISNDSNTGLAVSPNSKPIITIQRESAALINIVVTHDKEIVNVTYTINDEEPVQIAESGQTEIKEEVELPIGNSTITITAEDVKGNSSSYETSFEVEKKPNIKLEQVESKIQATVESTINIDRIAYYWDDDDSNATMLTINDLKSVTLIDVLEGTHTLTVAAIDIEGNQAMKSQKIIGATKPEIDITTDGQKFYIKASDEEGLSRVEITLNSNQILSEEIDEKEYSKDIPLENGDNKLKVTFYNKNGIKETSKVKYTKE